ncbi:MAG: metallophosphoesterase family protein [Burkholderiaceae bacterium]|jgi:diadenosine tetraphosphatase ApaH/serine/threonine PP2A family protein phosphatase
MLAVFTDLHANREATEACLRHAREHGALRYAFLGDLVGYGVDPSWVVNEVRGSVANGAIAVRGNHDAAVADGRHSTMRREANFVVNWTRRRLDADQIEFLENLPLSIEVDGVLFVHANAWDPGAWAYIHGPAEATRSLSATQCSVTFCGHTHTPALYHARPGSSAQLFTPVSGVQIPLSTARQWLVVCGSVGQPRDLNPAACYTMYDASRRQICFYRVPYDYELVASKLNAEGMPRALVERLVEGS